MLIALFVLAARSGTCSVCSMDERFEAWTGAYLEDDSVSMTVFAHAPIFPLCLGYGSARSSSADLQESIDPRGGSGKGTVGID